MSRERDLFSPAQDASAQKAALADVLDRAHAAWRAEETVETTAAFRAAQRAYFAAVGYSIAA